MGNIQSGKKTSNTGVHIKGPNKIFCNQDHLVSKLAFGKHNTLNYTTVNVQELHDFEWCITSSAPHHVFYWLNILFFQVSFQAINKEKK